MSTVPFPFIFLKFPLRTEPVNRSIASRASIITVHGKVASCTKNRFGSGCASGSDITAENNNLRQSADEDSSSALMKKKESRQGLELNSAQLYIRVLSLLLLSLLSI
jgi:hypothetical protein